MEKSRRRTMLSWTFVAALVVFSGVLGYLQYRWIGEVSRAESERLHGALQASLSRLSHNFNAEVSAACLQAVAGDSPGEKPPPRQLSHLVKGVFMAVHGEQGVLLRKLDPQTGEYREAAWPQQWEALHLRLVERANAPPGPPFGRGPGPAAAVPANVIEMVSLGREPSPERGPGRRDIAWHLIEFNLDYIRDTVMPALLQQYLGDGAAAEYYMEVSLASAPETVLFRSSDGQAALAGRNPDASTRLFEVRADVRRRGINGLAGPAGLRGPDGPEPNRRDARADRDRPEDRGAELPPPVFGGFERGRWLLTVRHKGASVEALVAGSRTRNLAVTGGLIALIVVAGAMLVRVTRQAQRLAELQMQFVAGVSHELRTPLTVMRTAGHNLQGNVALDPARVRRYGSLIEDQSRKLTAIVEQVLGFANMKAGRVIGARQPVAPQSIIEDALEASRGAIEQSGCTVATSIAADLPPVLADAATMQHALQNLIENGAKYGASGGWLGIEAARAPDNGQMVEIRIRDRGPGIPADEIAQVFDPFYRGKRPVEDQIHGTGLGLSLARRIVEANQGTIAVESEPGKGTDFIVRLPVTAANTEQDDIENTVNRG